MRKCAPSQQAGAFVMPGALGAGRSPKPNAGHDCLALAMLNREYGVWGGTSPNARTRHGGPRWDDQASLSPRSARRAYRPVVAAEVPVAVLRAWALAQGLRVHPTKGRIRAEIREAYVAAHDQGAA